MTTPIVVAAVAKQLYESIHVDETMLARREQTTRVFSMKVGGTIE
jgi:hypothetical protein